MIAEFTLVVASIVDFEIKMAEEPKTPAEPVE